MYPDLLSIKLSSRSFAFNLARNNQFFTPLHDMLKVFQLPLAKCFNNDVPDKPKKLQLGITKFQFCTL